MLKGSIAGYPWLAKFLILCGIFLFCEVIFESISLSIIRIVYADVDLITLLTQKLKEIKSADEISIDEIHALKIFQLITTLGRFISAPLIYVYLCGDNFIQTLHLNKKLSLNTILLIGLVLLASSSIVGLVNEWNQHINFPSTMHDFEESLRNMQQQADTESKAFLSTTSPLGLLSNIFIIAIVAAIGEEILFRGILQPLFIKWTSNVHAGVWITAFIFSFIHFEFFGFFPRVLLGALLGYLYAWSGNLRASITAHFINNALGVMAYYFINRGMISEQSTETSSVWAAIISLPVCVGLLYIYKRNNAEIYIQY